MTWNWWPLSRQLLPHPRERLPTDLLSVQLKNVIKINGRMPDCLIGGFYNEKLYDYRKWKCL